MELSVETQDKLTLAKAKYLGKLVRGTSEHSRFPKIGIVDEITTYGAHYGHCDSVDADKLIIRLRGYQFMWLNKNWTWEVYGDRTG